MESVFSPREIPLPANRLICECTPPKKKKVNCYVNLFKGCPTPEAKVPKQPVVKECFVKYADSGLHPGFINWKLLKCGLQSVRKLPGCIRIG